jgi:hypothetical protein
MRNSMPNARDPERVHEKKYHKKPDDICPGLPSFRSLSPPDQPVRDGNKGMAGIIKDLDIIETF